MKKYLLLAMAIVFSFVSCSEQQFLQETLDDNTSIAACNEFNALIEQARWGDGQAYLQLADRYRDGKGVDKDFVGMLSMVAQADKFGAINRMEDYLMEMPEGSDFKLIIDAIDDFENNHIDEAKAKSEQLIANGSPDGYSVQGIIAMEKGDTLTGIGLMERAAKAGSTFAELLLCFSEWRGNNSPDMSKLATLSDKIPFVNAILADIYTGVEDKSLKDEHLAIHYFLKADENAFLSRRGASWLLYYHESISNLPLSERDIQRLQILAGGTSVGEPAPLQKCEHEENMEVIDSVVVDTVNIE